jgi:hypothetical protein
MKVDGQTQIIILAPKLRLGTQLMAELCFANEIYILVRKRH